MTVNEPTVYCVYGYGGKMVPFVNHSGIADYLCGHHMLLAHAKAHKMYKNEFAQQQKGEKNIYFFLLIKKIINDNDNYL